jgi:hypothetical protein
VLVERIFEAEAGSATPSYKLEEFYWRLSSAIIFFIQQAFRREKLYLLF